MIMTATSDAQMARGDEQAENVHLEVHTGPEVFASADLATQAGAVDVRISVRGGHLPVHARRDLVEAVFEQVHGAAGTAVAGAVPLGDSELLDAMHSHLSHVRTRAAGCTCLIEAELPDDETGPTLP